MRSMQLGSYERMIDNSVRFYTGYIQIHKLGYWDEQVLDNAFYPPKGLQEQIESLDGVEAAVPRLESFALASFKTRSRGAMVIGIDPEKESHLTGVEHKITEGSKVGLNDPRVLMGSGLADYLNMKVGDTLVLISQGYHGVNAAGKYEYFYGAEGLLTAMAVVTDQPKDVDDVREEILGDLDTTAYEVMGWKTMMPELIQGIEIDNISGIIMLLLLYLVIGFGMFGTFLMMTKERLYEFGVMLSVGMHRSRLQLLIFSEIVLLAILAVLAGFALSLPVINYFSRNPISLPEEYKTAFEKFDIEPIYAFSNEPIVFTSQAWVVFFMALVLSAYPLYKIWKIDPVTAMREGR